MRIEGLDGGAGRRIGTLLAATDTTDVVDGHVAHLVPDGGVALTSDAADLATLLEGRRVEARIVSI